MWLFGYGSLIWKVDFPYKQQKIGYIKGFSRRFYQYSSDHRGTEEKPGRVVTLLPSDDPEEQVWGVAYEIADDEHKVWEHLDFREKNGYTRTMVMFYPAENKLGQFELVVYIGDMKNKWFAGEASISEIASHIVPCKGKSGCNIEYLCQLADCMRKIAPHIDDHHLYTLEKEALNIISKNHGNGISS